MAPLFGLRDRVAAILAVVAGLVLSACGGSELVQAVTEKSFASAAIPWDSPKATAETRRLALAASSAVSSSPYGAVQPSEAIEQLLNFGEVAYAVYFPGHPQTLTFQQYRYRYYPATGVYLGVADGTGGTVDGGVYVMGGPFGDIPAYVGLITSFITPGAWWPPKNITPMGVRVFGTEFAQLPAGCTSVNQQCWKDAIISKNVVFLTTTAKMAGVPGGWDIRPIIFAGTISAKGNPQMLVMFADTGELTNTGADIDAQVISEGIDFVVGNEFGYILKLKSTGQCLQWHWNPPTSTTGSANVWDYQVVACPQ